MVVALGAFDGLRPAFEVAGTLKPMSMNLVIQMVMLIAGAGILLACKVKSSDVASGAVFKSGMVAIISVYGVAWMSDTFFSAHLTLMKGELEQVVSLYPWMFALALFLVSKLVNSQAAAVNAMIPVGIGLGIPLELLLAFFPACYGYFLLPTYPSDLACIGFDRSGTTRIGKYVINHSFVIPGLIGVTTACAVGYLLVQVYY